jgi:hypothetical protein
MDCIISKKVRRTILMLGSISLMTAILLFGPTTNWIPIHASTDGDEEDDLGIMETESGDVETDGIGGGGGVYNDYECTTTTMLCDVVDVTAPYDPENYECTITTMHCDDLDVTASTDWADCDPTVQSCGFPTYEGSEIPSASSGEDSFPAQECEPGYNCPGDPMECDPTIQSCGETGQYIDCERPSSTAEVKDCLAVCKGNFIRDAARCGLVGPVLGSACVIGLADPQKDGCIAECSLPKPTLCYQP